ncbi:MAG: hypothetical protein Tsb009_34100 [Planctomycetaceae bacterium]
MVLAVLPAGFQSMLLGVAILFVALLMRRSAVRRSRKSRMSDPVQEVRLAFAKAEKEGRSELEKLEMRLYEFSREMEAGMETRLARLDQLVQQADKEIARLEVLLRLQQPGENSSPNVLNASERRIIRHLHAAGYSNSEIASLTGHDESAFRDLLRTDEPDDSPENSQAA